MEPLSAPKAGALRALDFNASRARAELLKRFHGATLGEKQMRTVEALRAAQVEMWKQKRWGSPYYWGGFMLFRQALKNVRVVPSFPLISKAFRFPGEQS
jgi:hypothetical protein